MKKLGIHRLIWSLAILVAAGLGLSAAKVADEYQAICARSQALCEAFQSLADEESALKPFAGTKPGAEAVRVRLLLLDKSSVSLKDKYESLLRVESVADNAITKPLVDPPFGALRRRIEALGLDFLHGDLAECDEAMTSLESRQKDLAKRLAPSGQPSPEAQSRLVGEFAALERDGTSLWERLHNDSLIMEQSGDVTVSEKNGAFKSLTPAGQLLTDSLNPLNSRLAELSQRLKEMESKLGVSHEPGPPPGATPEPVDSARQRLEKKGLLQNPFSGRLDAGPADPGAGGSFAVSAGKTGSRDPVPGLAARPSLLASLRAPGLPAPEAPPEPSRWKGFWAGLTGRRDPVNVGTPGQDLYPKDTIEVEKLKAKGRTLTAGNPAGRALYAYPQDGGTCAIASQNQILAEAQGGRMDQKTLMERETSFFKQSAQDGCFGGNSAMGDEGRRKFGGGTADHCLSHVLEGQGMHVRKRFGASDEDLSVALRRGKMLLVTVNSGTIWNDSSHDGGHAIVATGAEFERPGGRLLGVYINDTGYEPPQGGRFVNAAQFMKAWRASGATFIEPL